MKTTTEMITSDETDRPLCGVLLYENREAYARALDMYAYLAVVVSQEIPLQFSWWAFSMLHDAQHAAAARIAVAGADVVIVSAKPAADWSAGFKHWIESWQLPKAKRLSALGALLSPPQPVVAHQCGRQTYLQHVAARMGLDFLSVAGAAETAVKKVKMRFVASEASAEQEPSPVAKRPDYCSFGGVNGYAAARNEKRITVSH
jgi:hypothetical protein